ncbi:MAG: hypothetical protein JWQ90_4460 [Hydrocarboniphaga sp.]|uniref:hypothetical protein n=1 Tax=Hydrocarboniphaga sp. TaxID=2033016 RepID=UPI0026082E18|nr:hypothetical protein [Hydrocarboniphaga sp.]MDB5972010.1 hypothetical protein [Hydrocarboniphaga sp.]
MRSNLEMDSGPRFVKPAIIAAIALMLAGGFYAMTRPGDKTVAVASPDGRQQTAMAGDGNAPVAAEGADAPTAGMTASAAAPAPAAAPDAPVPPEPATTTAAPAAAAVETATEAPAKAPAPRTKPAPVETASASPSGAARRTPAADPVAADSSAAAASSSEAADHAQLAVKDQRPNRPAVRTPAASASDALRPWWNQTASDDRFGVQYVGQAADQPALVIRFSRQVSDPAAAQNIKLIAADGQPVTANWEQGQDPRVLYAPHLQPGRYTVVIDPQLASIDGESLGTQLHGPTYIQ